jgi:hypothetical protein
MLTPASPLNLPPLGELIADDPFWRYPAAVTPAAGAAHLRVRLAAGPERGHLGVDPACSPPPAGTAGVLAGIRRAYRSRPGELAAAHRSISGSGSSGSSRVRGRPCDGSGPRAGPDSGIGTPPPMTR